MIGDRGGGIYDLRGERVSPQGTSHGAGRGIQGARECGVGGNTAGGDLEEEGVDFLWCG